MYEDFFSGETAINFFRFFVLSRREAEAAAMAAAVEKQKVTDRYMNSPHPLPHICFVFWFEESGHTSRQ